MSIASDYKMYYRSGGSEGEYDQDNLSDEGLFAHIARSRSTTSSIQRIIDNSMKYLPIGGAAALALWVVYATIYQIFVAYPKEKATESAALKAATQVPEVLLLMLEEMTKMRVAMERLANSQEE